MDPLILFNSNEIDEQMSAYKEFPLKVLLHIFVVFYCRTHNATLVHSTKIEIQFGMEFNVNSISIFIFSLLPDGLLFEAEMVDIPS